MTSWAYVKFVKGEHAGEKVKVKVSSIQHKFDGNKFMAKKNTVCSTKTRSTTQLKLSLWKVYVNLKLYYLKVLFSHY